MKDLSNALDAVVDWRTLGIKKCRATSYCILMIDDAECKSEMLASCLQSDHPPSWKDALCWTGGHRSACKIRRKHLKSMKGTLSLVFVCHDILSVFNMDRCIIV